MVLTPIQLDDIAGEAVVHAFVNPMRGISMVRVNADPETIQIAANAAVQVINAANQPNSIAALALCVALGVVVVLIRIGGK